VPVPAMRRLRLLVLGVVVSCLLGSPAIAFADGYSPAMSFLGEDPAAFRTVAIVVLLVAALGLFGLWRMSLVSMRIEAASHDAHDEVGS